MRTWKEVIKSHLGFHLPWAEPDDVMMQILIAEYNLAKGGAEYREYIKNFDYDTVDSILFLSVSAIIADDKAFIRELTAYQGGKHLMSYILDILIPCAIELKRYEIQMMLTDYKYRNHLYREKKFDL